EVRWSKGMNFDDCYFVNTKDEQEAEKAAHASREQEQAKSSKLIAEILEVNAQTSEELQSEGEIARSQQGSQICKQVHTMHGGESRCVVLSVTAFSSLLPVLCTLGSTEAWLLGDLPGVQREHPSNLSSTFWLDADIS
ncbi:unnamed protein product, partial [Effrenium voratum]